MVLVAVGQLCSRGNVYENLKRCQSIIRRATNLGAKMVFLPEASDFITRPENYPSLIKSLDENEFIKGCKVSAKDFDCWISVGVHEKVSSSSSSEDGNEDYDLKKCFNTSIVISNKGLIEQKYQKLHLFDTDFKDGNSNSNESKFIEPGKEIHLPISTPIGSIGQLICYDLRFPEPSLIHRFNGAQILSYPSAFTIKTGGAHWETLLRARAIETQCYVIAAAQVGVHIDDGSTKRSSYGNSLIIDPWGTVISRVSDYYFSSNPKTSTNPEEEEEDFGKKIINKKENQKVEEEEDDDEEEDYNRWSTSFCISEIDLELLEDLRKSMPLIDQRRFDIYPKLNSKS